MFKISFLLVSIITVDINIKLVLLRKNVFLYRQMAMLLIIVARFLFAMKSCGFSSSRASNLLVVASTIPWYSEWYSHEPPSLLYFSRLLHPDDRWCYCSPFTTDPSWTSSSCLNASLQFVEINPVVIMSIVRVQVLLNTIGYKSLKTIDYIVKEKWIAVYCIKLSLECDGGRER